MIKNGDLYLVTEEKLSAGRKTIEVVQRAVAGGIDVIQLREKNKTTRARYQIGKKIKEIITGTEVDFIINDDPDLALALEADGVHLGDDDVPIHAAREVLGTDKIIGYSTSNLSEVKQAQEQGVDYVGFGAIYKTNSKNVKDRRQAIGLKKLRQVSKEVEIPIVAIGGINQNNITEVRQAGADAVAMISGITQAENIEKRVQRLNYQLKED